MAIEKLYGVEEAAEALGISHWTVWAKLKNGDLRRTKVGGRTVIRESELQKLIVDQPPKARRGQAKTSRCRALPVVAR
jgi:excisionase family DNA binding protein